MAGSTNSHIAPLAGPLLAFAILAGFAVTLNIVGVFAWLVASVIMLAMGRFVLSLEGRAWTAIQPDMSRRRFSLVRLLRTLRANPGAVGVFLHGLAMAIIAYTAFVTIGGILDAMADAGAYADSEGRSPYSAVFGSLGWWSLVVLAIFAAVRAANYMRPQIEGYLPFPGYRLLLFAVAFVLFADNGLLAVLLDAPTSPLLLIVGLIGVSGYIAQTLRPAAASATSARRRWPARFILAVTTGYPPVSALMGVALLPALAASPDPIQYAGYLETAEPYFGVLDSLAAWSLLLLFPILLIRLAATKWPAIGNVLPSPVAFISALAVTIILFAEHGILAVTYEYPTSGLMSAFAAAIALLYLAWVLRRVLRLDVEWRFKGALDAVLAPAASALIALGSTLPLLALLNDLPVINALMLDYVETERIGSLYQPYFAGVHEMRNLIAVLFFVVMFALTLPQTAWNLPQWQARPLALSVGFAIAGCLAWLLGLGMADLGYGYALAGSVAGAGLFSIAVTQMGLQFTEDSNSVPADAIRWMAVSKTRSFMPGAAIAVYVLLLRPIFYDTLAFAAIYEWLAVLLVVTGAVLRMRTRLQTEISVVEIGSSPSTDWSRHEQVLETRPDPRADTVSAVRQAWVDYGEPSGIWTYMMGLLCREGASPDAIRDVMSPLRDSSLRGNRSRRSVALDESFQTAHEVMDGKNDGHAGYTGSLPQLNNLAGAFIETGDDADALAAAVVAAYTVRGANVGRAVNLCFHLVHDDVGQDGRGNVLTRGRKRRQQRERRERLMQAVLEHLAGERDVLSLPVAVPASALGIYRTQAAALNAVGLVAAIAAGQAVEILSESDAALFVRTPQGNQGYVSRQALQRQPILPRDEAAIQAELAARQNALQDEIPDDSNDEIAGDEQDQTEREGTEITT